MHPAPSVIVFTVASGGGYGLLAWLGVLAGFGQLPPDLGIAALALGAALVSGGLLASTWHLGHRLRAWRALTQWRSSWLSREGVAAVAGYVPIAFLAYGWLCDGPTALAGWLVAAAAVATVVCTGMIYASLKPIRAWHDPWVVPGYLACAAASGGVLFNALATGFTAPVVVALAVAWAVKLGYWRSMATAAGPDRASATGLGGLGTVRPLDPPHTGGNYLLQEMGFAIARKHAAKLRRVALILGFATPIGLAIAADLLPPVAGAIARPAAAVLCVVGITVERWLFFAEARHTVTLYYR